MIVIAWIVVALLLVVPTCVLCWVSSPPPSSVVHQPQRDEVQLLARRGRHVLLSSLPGCPLRQRQWLQSAAPLRTIPVLCMSSETEQNQQQQRTQKEDRGTGGGGSVATKTKKEEFYDYTMPEDPIVRIKPAAMKRLRELKTQQAPAGSSNQSSTTGPPLFIRMGVRSGGCSGLSYVMDVTTADQVFDDDTVDLYPDDNIQCVVDSKSLLYLYGLELDYSTELIGGGFKFFNPNAEESCGCGSSFSV